ncbi:MAG TPA: tyrosine-protein phosphatase [Pseudomonadota bacterium]|nr:tyrosine-protein phosphatase [Pseudomonadota bacterium]
MHTNRLRAPRRLPPAKKLQEPEPRRCRRAGAPLGWALLLSLVAASGCAFFAPTPPDTAHLDGFPLRRFDRVDADLYRSAQPSQEQLRELQKRYGIRTVLKLNSGAEPVPEGVTLIHHPLNVLKEPSPQELQELLDVIDSSPKPLLIHCTHGEDRTGLVVALYRRRHGTATDAAYTDMMRHGFHPYAGVFAAWLHSAGWGS